MDIKHINNNGDDKMRKEWISYLNFQSKRTEQKTEKSSNQRRERFMMKNATHIHYYNFYNKLYSKSHLLHTKPMSNYLY